jgi:hypothetical protein
MLVFLVHVAACGYELAQFLGVAFPCDSVQIHSTFAS